MWEKKIKDYSCTNILSHLIGALSVMSWIQPYWGLWRFTPSSGFGFKHRCTVYNQCKCYCISKEKLLCLAAMAQWVEWDRFLSLAVSSFFLGVVLPRVSLFTAVCDIVVRNVFKKLSLSACRHGSEWWRGCNSTCGSGALGSNPKHPASLLQGRALLKVDQVS